MTGWLLDPLSHGIVVRALMELVVLGAVSGAVGCQVILHRISYSAESLPHGMFSGLVGASLLGLPLLLGGAVGILLAGLLIAIAIRFLKDSADIAIAVVVTTLFGLGVLMALSPASPPGIQVLLFGDPLAVSDADLIATAALGAVVLLLLWRSHDRLLAIGFDGTGGRSLGLSPGLVQALLLILVAATVLIGVRGLGNLLVAAILVGPAAAARLVTDRMAPMIATSIVIAVLAGIAGIYLSFHAGVAAGAAVVVCLAGLYLAAAVVAALRGTRPSWSAHKPGSGPATFAEGAGS